MTARTNSGKKRFIFLVVVLLLIAIVSAIFINSSKTKNKNDTDSLRSTAIHIMLAATEANNLGNQLAAGTKNSLSQEELDSILQKQKTADELMKTLQEPEEKQKAAYEAIQKLFRDYTKLINLVTNPDSQQDLSESLAESHAELVSAYQEIEAYIK